MKSHTTIHCRLPSIARRSYPVTVRRGFFVDPARYLAPLLAGRNTILISDTTVHRLYGRLLQQSLEARGIRVIAIDFPPGERSKTLRTAAAVQTTLLAQGVDRRSIVVALGGGVVGDLAGFVAATLLRGMDFIQIPTTLLAQVDSSIGGKVGVNHRLGKNLIGAFHQPRGVFIDPDVLRTLPVREFRNGLAEMVKIAVALDRRFFAHLERAAPQIGRASPATLAPLIARAAGLKAAVVARDERDTGVRAALNLGHTVGHALETATRHDLAHGEAVALGLAAEAAFAAEMGLLPQRDHVRMTRLLRALRLDVRIPASLNTRVFFRSLDLDKKSGGGAPKFALPGRIGTTLLGVSVPREYLTRLAARWSRR